MLNEPLSLPCGVVLRNRIAKSAMSEDMAGPGHQPSAALNQLYQRWGKGGAGLLLTGNVMVDKRALGEPHNVVIEADTILPALSSWAQAASQGGAQVWVQLNHPGRQSPRNLSREPVAPSAVPLKLPGKAFHDPRSLTEAEIQEIIARFARAAALCQKAGFGGVQIHGAHGYLISQFLSPLSNLREDDWGGDALRRRRFLMEVLHAVRGAVGPGYPVGLKLNSADFQRGGFSEEDSMAVVEALEGVDLLEISGGTYERPATTGHVPELKASTQAREAYFLSYARQVRGRYHGPLMLTGGFRSLAGMEQALSDGVDVIGMARPFAVYPELATELLSGQRTAVDVEAKRVPIAAMESISELIWCGEQLYRMGQGLDPDPGLSAWWALAKKSWRSI